MFGLGTWEMVIILAAALIFIGPGKLPELAKTLGKGMRELRRAMAGFETEARRAVEIPPEDEHPSEPESESETESETAPAGSAEPHHEAPAEPAAETVMPEVSAPEGPRVAAGRPGAAPASEPSGDVQEPEGSDHAESPVTADGDSAAPVETG